MQLIDSTSTKEEVASLCGIDIGELRQWKPPDVALAIGNLLCWLLYRPVMRGPVPLDLSGKQPWTEVLRLLIAESPSLSELFVIHDEHMDFSPTVGELERREIEKLVFENYQPEIVE